MRLLVLGHHGFVGRHILKEAQADGHEVLGIARRVSSTTEQRVRDALGVTHPEEISLDASDSEALHRVLGEVELDALIVATGVNPSGERKTLFDHEANVRVPWAVLSAVADVGADPPPAVVIIGSQAEYGDAPSPWRETAVCKPVGVYGTSKFAGTALALAIGRGVGTPVRVLRAPIVFGESQTGPMLVPSLVRGLVRGEPVHLTHGRQRRGFVHVADVARTALAVASERSDAGVPPLLNVPMFPPVSVRELATLAAEHVKRPDLLRFGAVPTRGHERLDAWPDTGEAERRGLAVAGDLRTALAKTIDWGADHLDLLGDEA